jgi:predicted N-acetyltransferase YhbS
MVSAPQLLEPGHDMSAFACGVPALDDWLRTRALANQSTGASRTYVACDGAVIVAYYALAVGAVRHRAVTGRLKRNMPEPIPAMVLARLAVDTRRQGKGLGADLLADAIRRTLQAAHIAGIRIMVVDAISDEAAAFYEHWGFLRSPAMQMRLIAGLADLAHALGPMP